MENFHRYDKEQEQATQGSIRLQQVAKKKNKTIS